MRAALITGHNTLELQEFPLPETAISGTVVVEVGLCGICGSDVSAYRDGEAYPAFLSGHEWGGTVHSVGDGVQGLAPGDRVVAGTPPACGTCAMCIAGHSERCQELTALSFGTHPLTPSHGAFAERIMVPAEMLIRVPDSLSDEQAAMIEPATVALHAIRRRPPAVGDTVAVLGGGPVGLFAAQFARVAGAGHVLVVEPRQRRRVLATELGADAGVEPGEEALSAVHIQTNGLGVDLVIDCVGSEAALASAVEIARPGGAITLVGAASGRTSVSPLTWMMKELTIVTSLAHLNHEFAITAEMIASGRVRIEPLLDLTVGLNDLDEVLANLSNGADHVKVLVDPRR
ncbi:zinc-dependent alcohol dehydrogenase [Rhodococcus koreensis]